MCKKRTIIIRRQSRSPARPCTACFREALRLSRGISRHKTLRKKTRKIYSTIPLTGLVLLVNRLCRSRGAERNSRHSVIGKAIIQAGNASLLFNRASLLRGQPRTPASPKELKGSYATNFQNALLRQGWFIGGIFLFLGLGFL